MRKILATNEKIKPKKQPKEYLGLFVKLYIDSLNDRKIRQMDPVTRCFWMDALMLAKKQRGVLPSVQDMAFFLRVTDAEIKAHIMRLVSLNLIDEDVLDGTAVWTIHQWDKWQRDSLSTERVRRHRKRQADANETQRNVSRNANETLGTYSYSTLSTVGKKEASHERKNDLSGSAPAVKRSGGAV